MEDLRKSLNEYLFHEFALDLEADESKVSETWPFELREVGRAAILIVFEFEDDQPYFALAGRSLNFLPKAGMTFDDLVLQDAGSRWIGARDPIDLSMSKPGDDAIPSGLERRRALEELAQRHCRGSRSKVFRVSSSGLTIGISLSFKGRRLQKQPSSEFPRCRTSLSDSPMHQRGAASHGPSDDRFGGRRDWKCRS